jgi:type VI secretion system protein ImpA
MATPEVLDFERLLAPIAEDRPAGGDPREDASPNSPYRSVRDARAAARAAERRQTIEEGDDGGGPPPDWRAVVESAKKALAGSTKDLEITAYLIEGLVRLHGFAGLRDGFRLTRELVERYWDDLYPRPDEDGLETRIAPLVGLNGDAGEGALIGPIALVPLTQGSSVGPMTFASYQQAVALAKLTDPNLRARKLAQGGVSFEDFQQAIRETPAPFFEGLVEDLQGALGEFARYNAALDERCGPLAPPASGIRTALSECLDVVKDQARAKLPQVEEPGPSGDGEPPAAPAAASAGEATAAAGAIRTREDAFRELQKVAQFFRRTEPHTVISYALDQVVRWGRMPLPELLSELIPDEGARRGLFKQVGITPPAESPES